MIRTSENSAQGDGCPGSSDTDLVARARRGDRTAFSALVDRYRGAVYGVAYHYLMDRDDAQDAAQEAFVHAYLRLSQLQQPERFGPWLRRITANVCLDVLRRRGAPMASLDALPEWVVHLAAPAPDEDLERLAVRITVRNALQVLSPLSRLTLTLF
jgi:RNA polymerase sigma-70 factor, ECF subfamily